MIVGFLLWNFVLSPLWVLITCMILNKVREKRAKREEENKRIEDEIDYQKRLELPIDRSNIALKRLEKDWHIITYLSIPEHILDDPIVKKGIRFLKLKKGPLETEKNGLEYLGTYMPNYGPYHGSYIHAYGHSDGILSDRNHDIIYEGRLAHFIVIDRGYGRLLEQLVISHDRFKTIGIFESPHVLNEGRRIKTGQ